MSFKTVYRDEILGINWSLSGIDTWELLLKGKYLVYFVGSPYKSLSICIASSFLLFLLIDSRIEGLIDREGYREIDRQGIYNTNMHAYSITVQNNSSYAQFLDNGARWLESKAENAHILHFRFLFLFKHDPIGLYCLLYSYHSLKLNS